MITGNNILIYEGDTPVVIAASKSCTISRRADTRETSSPASSTGRSYASGRTDLEISLSNLVLAVEDNLVKVGNVYTITIGERSDSTDSVSCTAICTECQLTGSVGALAQGAFKFLASDPEGVPHSSSETGYDMTADQVAAIVDNVIQGAFLSRVHADTAAGLITFEQGMYVPTGKALRIGDAYFTYDSDAQMVKVWDGAGNEMRGIYATGSVSALGQAGNIPAGSVDLAAVWASLTNNTGAYQDVLINVAHIPTAALSSLSDVNVASVTDGKVLKYDASTSKWVPGDAGSSSTGTVTSITAGTGLSGGTITTSGTISINTTWMDGKYIPLTGSDMIAGTLEPRNNNSFNIGATGYRWANGYFYNLYATTTVNTTTVNTTDVDATGVVHADTGVESDGYVSALGSSSSSDERMKDVLYTHLLSLDEIANAPCVDFLWKHNGKKSSGSIAQYWQERLPGLVHENSNGMLSMEYGTISLMSVISLANEVRALKEEVQALKNEIQELKGGNE